MTHKSALYFRDAFREARLKVLANAEHYQELLFVLERLGKHLTGKGMGLGGSELAILGLVAKHGTLQGQPASCIKFLPIHAFTARNTGFSGRSSVRLKFTASEDKPHAIFLNLVQGRTESFVKRM